MEPIEDTNRSIYNLSLYLTKTHTKNKHIVKGKKASPTNSAGKHGMSPYRRMEYNLCLVPYTKTNSK